MPTLPNKSELQLFTLPTMASHFVLTLFHQLFNIFIHSTGDGRILARVHGLIQKEPTQSNNLLLLVPIALSVILDILVSHS